MQNNLSGDDKGKKPAVIVAPADDDCVDDEVMKQYGIVAYPPLRILLCTTCHSVINPKDIYRHLRSELSEKFVGKTYCKQLVERFALQPKESLKPPSTLRSAIPYLELKEGYVCCTNCNRATEHLSSLKSAHNCTNFEVRKGPVQAFFPNAHQGGFFGVIAPPKPRDVQPSDIDQVLEENFPDLDPANLPIALPENPRDGNHFLTLQGWVPALNGLNGAQIWFVARVIHKNLRNIVSESTEKYMGETYEALRRATHPMTVSIGSYTGFVHLSPLFSSLCPDQTLSVALADTTNK